MRCAIYCRVSSAQQRDRDTIASQMRILPDYARAQGWTIVGTYVDDGRSAATGKLDAREGFAELVAAAGATPTPFDVVLCVDVNRLTRTEDAIERARILGPFQRAGIAIATPTGGVLDLRTLMGELYVTMQALFAAEENRKRSEATRRGKAEAKRQGRKAGGATLWGLHYDRESHAWTVHPEHGPICREMVVRVAAGESCRSIAADLDARGIRPKGRARFWSGNRVWDIVTSRWVVGELAIDLERRVKVAVPPIVDEATWTAAQEVLRAHRKSGLRRTRHVYLLEGIARCGACGERMHIRASHNNTVKTYVCAARLLRDACPSPVVRCDEIEPAVWSEICAALRDPDLAARIAADEARCTDDARDWQGDVAGYERHLARLESVENALWTRFRRGTIDETRLDAELVQLRRERDGVQAQLATAQRAISNLKADRARVGAATSIAAELGATLDSADPAMRREVALAVIVEPVVFHGQDAHFEIAVPRARIATGGGRGGSGALVPVRSRSDGHEILATFRVVAKR